MIIPNIWKKCPKPPTKSYMVISCTPIKSPSNFPSYFWSNCPPTTAGFAQLRLCPLGLGPSDVCHSIKGAGRGGCRGREGISVEKLIEQNTHSLMAQQPIPCLRFEPPRNTGFVPKSC